MEMEIRRGAAAPGHAVQFYETATLLGDAVARFLLIGWRTGQPLVVVATEPHREAIHRGLMALGCDSRGSDGKDRILFLDAGQTLSTFMVDGRPDEALFNEVASSVFERIRKTSRRRRILFYGEMVDVLWRGGNPDAALRLEHLWNVFATQQSFSLLCGYATDNFSSDETDERLGSVCRLHDHVVAAMTDAPANAEMARFRSRLQQRARHA
jgi:hypothetical protein